MPFMPCGYKETAYFTVKYSDGRVVHLKATAGSLLYEALIDRVINNLSAKERHIDGEHRCGIEKRETMESMPLSRKKLIEYLIEDGFTPEQAEYAANAIEGGGHK